MLKTPLGCMCQEDGGKNRPVESTNFRIKETKKHAPLSKHCGLANHNGYGAACCSARPSGSYSSVGMLAPCPKRKTAAVPFLPSSGGMT
jgi:hypothetical protein